MNRPTYTQTNTAVHTSLRSIILSQPMDRETTSRGRPAAIRPAVCPLAAAARILSACAEGRGGGKAQQLNLLLCTDELTGPAHQCTTHARRRAWSKLYREDKKKVAEIWRKEEVMMMMFVETTAVDY